MSRKLLPKLGSIGAIAAILMGIFIAMPLKPIVTAYAESNHYLAPIASSVGMLASFCTLLLFMGVVIGLPAVIVDHYRKAREAQVSQPQQKPPQVPYGFHTPVPR